MGKNLPLIIAVAGGALVFMLWKQRQAQAAIAAPAPQAPQVPVSSAWDNYSAYSAPLVGTYEAGWT